MTYIVEHRRRCRYLAADWLASSIFTMRLDLSGSDSLETIRCFQSNIYVICSGAKRLKRTAVSSTPSALNPSP